VKLACSPPSLLWHYCLGHSQVIPHSKLDDKEWDHAAKILCGLHAVCMHAAKYHLSVTGCTGSYLSEQGHVPLPHADHLRLSTCKVHNLSAPTNKRPLSDCLVHNQRPTIAPHCSWKWRAVISQGRVITNAYSLVNQMHMYVQIPPCMQPDEPP